MPLLHVVPRPDPDPVEAARERLARAAWRLYHQARRDLRALGGA